MIIIGKIHAYKQKTILSVFKLNFRKSHKASRSLALQRDLYNRISDERAPPPPPPPARYREGE